MKYRAIDDGTACCDLSEAMHVGAPPEGGLFVPGERPRLDVAALALDAPLHEIAAVVLAPFFAGDRLANELDEICREAFSFSAPLIRFSDAPPLYALELFHGPTGAFKDFGARFLAACLSRLRVPGEPMTIVTATSGDTGGAVGAAFEAHTGVRVAILYPKGRVSPFQEHQLTCWGGGVSSFAVDRDFDACQTLAKAALTDAVFHRRFGATSANSINLGRLLPQMAYYAQASLKVQAQTGAPANFIVPTGNLGNAVACHWARAIGLPIGRVVIATNANTTLKVYSETGVFQPRASISTLASAMDVGAPNNFKRLSWAAKEGEITPLLEVHSVDDEAIKRRIKHDHNSLGVIWCPHSATAAETYARLDHSDMAQPWVIVATAHPAKFREIVEPVIGCEIEVPGRFRDLLERPVRAIPLEPSLEALADSLAET